jgi:hypothetical protein
VNGRRHSIIDSFFFSFKPLRTIFVFQEERNLKVYYRYYNEQNVKNILSLIKKQPPSLRKEGGCESFTQIDAERSIRFS